MSEPILSVDNLSIRYRSRKDDLTAVDGVSLSVPLGGTLGLVGESGCGKSSLARALVGLAPVTGGQVLLDGVDVTSESKRQSAHYRRRVQMVFQDPAASLNPRMTIAAMLEEALKVGRRGRGGEISVEGRTPLGLLELVGLGALALHRYPHEFSGGQQQRISIARALAVNPEVIITDEITSALDVSVQATILNLLKELQSELGLSLLFISHDLSTVRYMSDVVSVMYLGRVVETGDTDQIFSSPRHPYTKALLDSIPQVSTQRRAKPLTGDIPDPRHPPAGCRFHTRCSVGPLQREDRALCLHADPRIGIDDPHPVACHFPLTNPVDVTTVDVS